jgi:AcrR family transcriptional regulator
MPRPLPPQVIASAGSSETEAVRDHILDAAHRVIAAQGLAAASTRAIATEAGVAVGTVYNYFDNRLELLAEAILRRAHELARPLDDLAASAGTSTVTTDLLKVAGNAAAVLDEMVPLFAAAFSDSELLAALQHELAASSPSLDPAAPIEKYLLAERKLGRIADDADCHAAANTVVSLCHESAFHHFFAGAARRPAPMTREIALVVRALTT